MVEVQTKIISPEEENREFQRRISLDRMDKIREGTSEFEYLISWINHGVRKNYFTLEDIGTSEEELQSLLTSNCKMLAQEDLNLLRTKNPYYDIHIRSLELQVEKGNISLEDIGTSEKELKQLKLEGAKLLVQQYIAHVKSEIISYDCFINFLKERIQDEGLALEDVGINEKVLEEIKSSLI